MDGSYLLPCLRYRAVSKGFFLFFSGQFLGYPLVLCCTAFHSGTSGNKFWAGNNFNRIVGNFAYRCIGIAAYTCRADIILLAFLQCSNHIRSCSTG